MKKTKNAIVLCLITVIVICFALVSLAGVGNFGIGAKNIHLGLDLAGGVSITYQAAEGTNPTADEMDGALAVIQRRLDAKGYTEANAFLDGSNRIRVEIPGVADASAAVEEIGRTAMLRFIGVDYNRLLSSSIMEEFYERYMEDVRAMDTQGTTSSQNEDGSVSLSLADITDEELRTDAENYFRYYYTSALTRYPEVFERAMEEGLAQEVVTGLNVSNATYQKGQTNATSTIEAYVKLEFDNDGKNMFAEATKTYLNKHIAILLDNTVISMPTVNSVINDGVAIISGIGTDEAAKVLADDIRGGALPVQLKDIEHKNVGATLGMDALQTSILAGIIGFAIIILFMIIFYRIPGTAASIALVFYVSAELFLISAFNWTLTLAGIAGIILSVGMAVDANIIIFSRIREEMQKGHTIRVSVKDGFNKALSAIFDGNVTTLIASIILYFFGSGTIKGFAQTLALGIVLSMFCALVVSRVILSSMIALLPDAPALYASVKKKEVKAK